MTFLIAVLTGLGVGSGGLYIFYLTFLKGVGQASAQGLNLIFFITASLAAGAVSLIKKRISPAAFFLVAPFGVLGAILGSEVASKINASLLSVLFGILIFTVGLVGFVTLLKKKR